MSDDIIQLNEAAIKGEFENLVRNSVEETRSSLLDHEAEELLNAKNTRDSVIVKVIAPDILIEILKQPLLM